MATLATPTPDDTGGALAARPRPRFALVETSPQAPRAERAGYRPSRRSAPLALAASLGMVGAILGTLVLANLVVPAQEVRRKLTVVSLSSLDQPPPPPPAAHQTPSRASLVTAPAPRLSLPVKAPEQPAMMVPFAPPPQLSAPTIAPTAPTTTPAAAAGPPAVPLNAGDLSARMISAVAPQYPIEARRRHEEGTVKLRVVLGPDGRVDDIGIATSSGSALLDGAALGAVRRWRWSPTVRDGAAVMVSGFVTIPFILKA